MSENKIDLKMTNAELAEAISAAYARAGNADEVQREHKKQMESLLKIQLMRASIGFISKN